jgi:hypothetical protein
MSIGLQQAVPLTLGVVSLAGVGLLLLWDIVPKLFPAVSHDFLAAFPLAMIACVWLVHEATRRPARWEVVKAVLLASAFLFFGPPTNFGQPCARRYCSTISLSRFLSST